MVRRILTYAILGGLMLYLPADGGQRNYRSPFAVGIGAVELGRGGAGVAGFGNAGSIYWNPALLALVDRSEVQLFHMSLFMDTRYQFAGAVYPTLASGGFGLGVGSITSGKFDRYDNYRKTGSFSSSQNLLMFGYGFSPLKRLAVGATVKGVLFDIDQYKDSGFGFDLGAIYAVGFVKGLSAGLKIGDIAGPRIRLHEIEQRFPLSARGGLTYSRGFANGISGMAIFDLEKIEKSGTDVYSGLQVGISDIVFVRGGYMADRPTFGVGVSHFDIRFDYAYASLNDMGTSHRLSLTYAFGGSVQARRQASDARLIKTSIDELNRNQETLRLQRIDSELNSARAHESQSDPYKALESYYRVLALDDQNAESRQKVTALFDQIRLDLTRQASNEYIQTLISKQLDLGNNYLGKKQYDKAAEQFGFVLVLEPKNQNAGSQIAAIEKAKTESIGRNRQVARESTQKGDYKRTLDAYDNILALAPDDPQAITGKADIYRVFESSKHLDRAIRLYDQESYLAASVQVDSALALNPKSEGAKGLKHRLTQYTAKETTLEDIKKVDADWKIYIQGMEKYQAGDYDKALELWRSLLNSYPNNPNLKRNIDQAAERSSKKP